VGRCHTEECSQSAPDSELEGGGGVEEEQLRGYGPKTGRSAIEEEENVPQFLFLITCKVQTAFKLSCLHMTTSIRIKLNKLKK
jgi:hypothetical protein